MCNTLQTQRQIAVERLTAKFVNNHDTHVRGLIPQLLGEAFDAGVMEAEREEAPPVDDAQLDEAMREIEAERDAHASGSVEPPKGGWLSMVGVRHCLGHESTEGPIGNVVFCDGSCRRFR